MRSMELNKPCNAAVLTFHYRILELYKFWSEIYLSEKFIFSETHAYDWKLLWTIKKTVLNSLITGKFHTKSRDPGTESALWNIVIIIWNSML